MDNIQIRDIENGWLVQCTSRGNYPSKDYYCIDIHEINRRVEEFLFRPVEDNSPGLVT